VNRSALHHLLHLLLAAATATATATATAADAAIIINTAAFN